MKHPRHGSPARDALKDDLAQLDLLLKEAIAKLSVSFVGAHEALARQQALADHANPECAALAKLAGDHLDAALTALQFEDIASQLIASARRHLGGSCGNGGAGKQPDNDKTGGDALRADCAVDCAVDYAVNRSVPQQHMESGSIELF
ncbi:MAG: hypothetical protein RL404_1513 [Pseudomonadota bacterium]|jgi:hypothetical protein